jgi:hypothetical protein
MERDDALLEHLLVIRETLDRLVSDVRQIKRRQGILEMQYATLSSRLLVLDERVVRIEKRLDPFGS